jgi:hypothetical protein
LLITRVAREKNRNSFNLILIGSGEVRGAYIRQIDDGRRRNVAVGTMGIARMTSQSAVIDINVGAGLAMPCHFTIIITISAVAIAIAIVIVKCWFWFDPIEYKSIRFITNRSDSIQIDPNEYKSIRMNTNRSKWIQIDPNEFKSIRINSNRSE